METGQKTTPIRNNGSQIAQNKLSIQVSLNGLSFCIKDGAAGAVSYYKELVFEDRIGLAALEQALVEEIEALDGYDPESLAVKVIHDNELNTLVPKPLFNEDHLADYLKFNTRILKNDFIAFEPVLADAYNIFIPYANINNKVFELFGDFEYSHASTLLINQLVGAYKHTKDRLMIAYVSAFKHFELIIINNGELELYNSFHYNNADDFIYYVLFTAEQMEMNPETFSLYILGLEDESHPFYERAYTYVRNIHLEAVPHKIEIPETYQSVKNNLIALNSY